MASEYTPTTAAVRSGYAATEHFAAAFDRWLAVEKAAAWDEGALWGFCSEWYGADRPNPYRSTAVRLQE